MADRRADLLAGGLAEVRRLAAALAVLLVGAGAFVALGASGGGGARGYRVDAIFDNADFLVSGQDVKIAGAVVGQVTGVHLTRDRRARIEMQIEDGFAPFRSDATCTIRPQSLIGEKFVACDPGTPKGRPLSAAHGEGAPVVPLARNHSPVDLDLVFAALRLPYRQRLTLLVNELGTGLAGRPEDLNAAIRRANPALQQANRVLAIVDRDRHTLARLIDASDIVVAKLAQHRGEVASFIGRADRVARAVADRRGDLGLSIHRLPPLLDQLEPSAVELAGLANEARPVARDLRTAAGPLRLLLGDFKPLTDAARPTLEKLDELSVTGRRALRATDPIAQKLLPVAQRLPEVARLGRLLNENLKSRGAVEGLQRFVYFAAASTARFDRFSHILPSYQIGGTCQQYATAPVEGCSANFHTAAAQKSVDKQRQLRQHGRKQHRTRPRDHRSRPPRTGSTPSSPAPAAPAPVAPPATPQVPSLPDVQHLLDYLLGP
jgi:phospholipid/cholesterol/gamma-HCH transport system substrate-binding protein